MYCVIQKVVKKKPNMYGASKELLASTFTLSYDGIKKTKYTYHYSEERFERPIKDAYKISIHKSYRENGKVKKKQWSICTMGYYEVVEFSLYDCAGSKIKEKSKEIGITEDELYEMIYEKLDPLTEQIRAEFESTAEYKTKKSHEQILKQYRAAKTEFEKKYGSDTYDYCYDVFGVLRNEAHLKELEVKRQKQEEYQRSSYYNKNQSNYNQQNYNYHSGYSIGIASKYSQEEKAMLKKIYREASKRFHPDITNDDGKMMKFLTKLKTEWGI